MAVRAPGRPGRRPSPVTRFLDTASPEALFVLSAVFQYIGATIAVLLFDEVAPQTVAWLRMVGAAIAVLAVSGAAWRGWTRRELAAAAVFGIATAAMNTFFYLAIDRTDLGKSVAIEFIGPIAVAAVMTRTRRNAAALGARRGRASSSSAASSSTTTPPACSTSWRLRRVGPPTSSSVHASPSSIAASSGLGIGLAIGAVVLTPIGAPGSGAVWTTPSLLAPASSSACSPTPSATASTSTSCAGSPSAASPCCWRCCR